MGKSTKRERQKANKMMKDLERARIENRAKRIKAFSILGVILILPIVIIISMVVNSATTPSSYTAKIVVSIDDKEIGTIDVKLDEPNAPKSLKRFIQFPSNGIYNGVEFTQVVKDGNISAGSLNADGSGSYGNTEQVEGPPRDFESGDLIWSPDPSQTPLQAGSSFTFLTGTKKSEIFGKNGINQKTQANEEQKASYRFGYIGYITKGIDIARKIEALAPPQEIDPATGKPKVDEKGNIIPPEPKPLKVAKIIRITVYKDGKAIKVGDYANITTTSTSTTVPNVVTTPTQ